MTFPCLFVVSGPSGVGKTSLVNALAEVVPHIACPVSYTTRPPRPGERPGIDYHFVTAEQFDVMIAANEFLEHALVFGNRYGTSRLTVEQLLADGAMVLLEIDWQGAAQARNLFDEAITVMVLPPSIQNLRDRLEHRQQDDNSEIKQRMLAATRELSHYDEYDYLIINDDFDTALEELRNLVAASKLRRPAQQEKIRRLLPELNNLTDLE